MWWLVSPGIYLYALLVARRCSGRHTHLGMHGYSPEGIPRTREAAAYPLELCIAWAVVLLAAFEGLPLDSVKVTSRNVLESLSSSK